MKKYLIKFHRYLGLPISVLVTIWFLSGFVMIFSSFPKPDSKRYKPLNEPINQHVTLNGIDHAAELTIGTRLSRLQVAVTDSSNLTTTLSYPDLKSISSYGSDECLAMASAATRSSVAHYEKISDYDMWIPWEGYKRHFPIYRCTMDDEKGSVVYVSSTTGEIVQETTRQSRFWAYIGAIPHWVYIKHLRLHLDLWIYTIIILSGLATLVTFMAIPLGVVLLRRWRSPYKKRLYRWHHILGIFFGIPTFTFLFSGLMSVCSIPNWLVPSSQEVLKPRQETISTVLFTRPIDSVLAYYPSTNRIDYKIVASKPYYKLTLAKGNQVIVGGTAADTMQKRLFSINELKQEYTLCKCPSSYTIELQQSYDSFYQPTKGRLMELPVYKLTLADGYGSTYYISPKTLELLSFQDHNSRIYRWTYRFLHSLDSQWLYEHSFVRRSVEILLLLGGLLLSLTAVVLTFKRIFPLRRHSKN